MPSKSIVFLFFFTFAWALTSGNAWALSLDSVRVGDYPEKTRLVLELSNPVDFKSFVLDDPYRLVVDLPEFTWRAGTPDKLKSVSILSVRQGVLKPGISRLVFDVAKPIKIQSAFVLPRQDKKPDRVVIDFTQASLRDFKEEKNLAYGNLSQDGSSSIISQTPAPQLLDPVPSSSLMAGIPLPASKPTTENSIGGNTIVSETYKPLIVIDPGHGGQDPGAIGHNGLHEKNVVLALAKELKAELEDTGRYRVILTRDNDKFIKLANRVKFARERKADLFISLHADSLDKKDVKGASFYTLSEKASDAQTAKLAARENKSDLIAGVDLSVEDEEVVNILMDLAMRDTMNQSKYFANSLVKNFKKKGMRVLDNPHRSAGFAVLKAPDVPSVLVEAGFMSNSAEAELLNTPAHRQKLARALLAGIEAYFEQVQKNQKI